MDINEWLEKNGSNGIDEPYKVDLDDMDLDNPKGLTSASEDNEIDSRDEPSL